MDSWHVGRSGPAPQVIFEIVAEETWYRDLYERPRQYASMGRQEYFVYDPHKLPVLPDASSRLLGWRRTNQTDSLLPLQSEPDGRLWSIELDSWLVPDGLHLRLYDRSGQLWLTEAEAQRQRRELVEQRAQAEAQRAQAAEQRARLLAEKLRTLGIDPDQPGVQ